MLLRTGWTFRTGSSEWRGLARRSAARPSPGLIEYKMIIQPVRVEYLNNNRILITNRYDFITLDHLYADWSVTVDGRTVQSGVLLLPRIGPGESEELFVPTRNDSQLPLLEPVQKAENSI